MVVVLVVCIFGGFIVYCIVKYIVLCWFVLDWKSWIIGKWFLMGFLFVMMFVIYLVIFFFVGV